MISIMKNITNKNHKYSLRSSEKKSNFKDGGQIKGNGNIKGTMGRNESLLKRKADPVLKETKAEDNKRKFINQTNSNSKNNFSTETSRIKLTNDQKTITSNHRRIENKGFKNSPRLLQLSIKNSRELEPSKKRRNSSSKTAKNEKNNNNEKKEETDKVILLYDENKFDVKEPNKPIFNNTETRTNNPFENLLQPKPMKLSELNAEAEPTARILLTRFDGRRTSVRESDELDFHTSINKIGERYESKLINRELEMRKHQEYTEKVIKEQQDYYKYNQRNPIGLHNLSNISLFNDLSEVDYCPNTIAVSSLDSNIKNNILSQRHPSRILGEPKLISLSELSGIVRPKQPNFFYRLLDSEYVKQSLNENPQDFESTFKQFRKMQENE
ncbi:hypothetical protein K502DRAFT_341312 [Neoconidiobolus thromboides FSU 785]|nr:hypothetical protein K502DRAFT_341312 [Neoconidiobolus thromboides FSU 785]